MAKTAKRPVQKKVVRVGNFFVKKENEHYKMYDINNVWTMRVHYLSSMYTFLDVLIEDGSRDILETIVKMYYALCTTPPDTDMIKDTYTAYMALMERMKPELKTDQEGQQELERVKTMREATEQIKEAMSHGADEGPTQG